MAVFYFFNSIVDLDIISYKWINNRSIRNNTSIEIRVYIRANRIDNRVADNKTIVNKTIDNKTTDNNTINNRIDNWINDRVGKFTFNNRIISNNRIICNNRTNN